MVEGKTRLLSNLFFSSYSVLSTTLLKKNESKSFLPSNPQSDTELGHKQLAVARNDDICCNKVL